MKSLIAVFTFFVLALQGFAHCQIPCGVYTDDMRFTRIEEDLQTIEKAMAQIKELSAASSPDYATIVRWTSNKEIHAGSIQEIVSVYFMTQRIKPDAASYEDKLKLLHGMLISAMKCKQTLDPAHVAKTRELTARFYDLYFGKTKAADHAGHDHSGHDH
jgi:nickel superoxide dismutase